MRTTIAAALLLATVCVYGQGGGPPRLQWQTLVPDDHRFSVSMPGKPELKTQRLEAKNGRPVQYTAYTVDLGRTAFMTSTSDYDEQTEISLDGAIDGVMSTWKDPRNLNRRKTTLYGHPAQVVEFDSEQYHVVVRAFAVGKRLYQLGFVAVSSDFVPAQLDTFMSSFRLR